ncbi:MAG TPA: HAD family hydrolase [Bacilli bacterium]|nr:HAD family hydrolase [Bacilli bacterium]
MIFVLFKTKSFLPYDCYKTIFDINYTKLYDLGKRVILIDIDNTIIPYDLDLPEKQHLTLINNIKTTGFQVIFISNNHYERVQKIALACDVNYVYSAYKPFRKGFKKALKMVNYQDKSEIITIGDQVVTDILGSNLYQLDAILVKPIKKKNERWFTKLNRIAEKRIIKRMMKKYPAMALKIINLRGE